LKLQIWENSLSKGRDFENLAKISLSKGRVPEVRFVNFQPYTSIFVL